ncbi:hypothetical protein M2139_001397 [Enterococcus sp. PF1-24]|uniref:hypothetical protein n=1 Tax=unclassified Enterococcus TaxID=2608891 RepID=UPI00247637D8|nr:MULTISPECIES: hypothetical protein [unclassified Enterococcus]MDH6364464.1 hypothetical protein [Enterococcus sp. PFB1-1]MDH6401513.1 hypothetical protein [Enterococcus sp. PF1-24]
MITVNSAMQGDNIIALLEGLTEGEISYKFKEKKGIQLIFEITGDKDQAIRLAKDSIKATDWGRILFFNVA